MDRQTIIARLKAHEPELRQAGITGLSIFGSQARGEATEQSDVDLAVRIDPAALGTGFAYFAGIERLQSKLKGILGREVDVVMEPARRASLRSAIERDRTVAF